MHDGQVNEPRPPAPFRRVSTDAIERRQGGGCVSVLGLPFFLAGLGLLLLTAGFVPVGQVTEEWWGRLLLALLSLLFLAGGGAAVLGRRWLRLDRQARSLVRQIGFLIPMRTESRSLDDFNAVVMTFRLGGSDEPDRYPLSLRARAGKDFVIASPASFGDSRTLAEFMSRFLSLPLVDTTTDSAVVADPEHVGETLQWRLRAGANQAERPASMHCQVSESGDRTTIVIPPRKSTAKTVFTGLFSFFVILVAAPFLWHQFSATGTPMVVGMFFTLVVVILFGVLPLASTTLALGLLGSTVVTASPDAIVIQRKGVRRDSTTVITAADILDVDYSTFDGILESARQSAAYPPGALAGNWIFDALRKSIPSKGIAIKTKQDLVMFGEGLPAGELRFLKWVLIKALTGK
jgi:hypothetical protein